LFVSGAFPELGTTAAVMNGVEFVMLPLDFTQAKIHNYFSTPKDECKVCINSNSNILSMPLEVVLSHQGVELKIMRGETLMAKILTYELVFVLYQNIKNSKLPLMNTHFACVTPHEEVIQIMIIDGSERIIL
jgi:hypothetical protein